MREIEVITKLRRRLIELGCPAAEVERQAREVAEHHQDLKQAAMEEGLAEADADARASELLGEPVALAERLALVLRRSSWWGRHRVMGFCVLPPLVILITSGLVAAGILGLVHACSSAETWGAVSAGGPGFGYVVAAVEATHGLAVALITVLFCWLARRSAAGWNWVLVACAVCTLQSSFGYCWLKPHALAFGYSTSPQWLYAMIPLVIGAAAITHRRRTARGLVVSPGA
jgi:hypothetical protein